MLHEHQLLLFWLQLLVLLASARGLGALARSMGQPGVVGELAAGLLLGPSVLGRIAPGLFEWLFPPEPTQRALVAAVAWIGVFLLLVDTGFETDLGLIRRFRRAMLRVCVGSLVLPVCVGIAIGLALPASFLGPEGSRVVFALFMGTALGISALPVIARILSDLDLMRRDVAQVTIAAAMANDVAGWTLLGVVSGLARFGSVSVQRLALTLVGLTALGWLSWTWGQRGIDAALRRLRVQRSSLSAQTTVVALVALCAGVATHAIGLEAVLGAFLAGVLIGRSRYHEPEVFDRLRGVTAGFFAPIFFASAGLRVDLGLLADASTLGWGLAVLAAATASKLVGSYAGARSAGFSRLDGLAIGAGLNARGAVEIVIATVGLSLGILGTGSYSIVVLMAMATSMMAPPMLRAVMKRWPGSEEEQARLARERQLVGNVLLRPARILLPSHGGPNSILAARIVDLVWPEGQEVTVLSAGADVPRDDLARVFTVFGDRPLVHEHVPAKSAIDAILGQAALGYGAIALGATDLAMEGRLASPIIDDLLARSPLPLLMVRRGALPIEDVPRWERVMVPVTGTRAGRAALEVALAVGRHSGASVLLAHVVTAPEHTMLRQDDRLASAFSDEMSERGLEAGESGDLRLQTAERLLAEARALAQEMGVSVETAIRRDTSAADALLALAREHDVDLVVLAAHLRQLSGRPFLGHGVEYLLARSESTVIVVTSPAGTAG